MNRNWKHPKVKPFSKIVETPQQGAFTHPSFTSKGNNSFREKHFTYPGINIRLLLNSDRVNENIRWLLNCKKFDQSSKLSTVFCGDIRMELEILLENWTGKPFLFCKLVYLQTRNLK